VLSTLQIEAPALDTIAPMTRFKWLTGVVLIALASGAQAHTHLKEALPADGSTVKAPPEQIMLTFSQAARLTALTIRKEGGEEVKLAPLPPGTSAHLMVPAPKLAPGKYTVSYRVVSDDNHVMSGKLHFTVTDSGPAKK
jgi:hypothetical protein